MTVIQPQPGKVVAVFRLLRLNRSIMVAIVTGSSAFAAGAGVTRSLWMTLAGWCLAVGGFSLDLYADRALDDTGPCSELRHNPLADGSLPPKAGLVFSTGFIIVSFAVTVATAPLSLLPWLAILATLAGMALHLLDTAHARALTLGLLQALFALMGSLAGHLSPGLGIIAAMFLFAMFGGRGMIDIRDYPQDVTTPVETWPKRYGIQRTAWISSACLLVAFALSLAAYFTGEFTAIYLYLDLVFIAVGLACTWLFVARPTAGRARVLTLVFMMGTGSLICLAMILGSIS